MLDTDAEVKTSAVGSLAVCEYIEEAEPNPRLLPFTAGEKAAARRLWQWSDESLAGINNTLQISALPHISPRMTILAMCPGI